MKKSFATLIKLQKTLVDEQRQHLARLMENLEKIENRIRQLEALRAREQAAAAKNEIARMTYGAFLKNLIAKRRELEKEHQAAAAAVRKAQERMAELFEEQKRYEIAEEQRIEEIEKEERRLERIELDEIGGVRHERKKSA
ncbi:MAG: flagellar FliJ family protein [Bdellovibrionales bacterium]